MPGTYASLIESTIIDQGLMFPDVKRRLDSHDPPPMLAHVLRNAATRVPYYRNALQAQSHGDELSLTAFPFTSKETLRDSFADLCVDDIDPSRCRLGYTSGTAGVPVRVIHDFDHFTLEAALGIKRIDDLALPRRRRVLMPMKTMDLDWIEYPSPWLWFSTIAEFGTADGILDAPQAHRSVAFGPDVIYGHPSDILNFARQLRHHDECIHPAAVSTFGEFLSIDARAEIAAHFGTTLVVDGYAMYEFGTIAEQCNAGTYHVVTEKVLLEVIHDSGRPAAPGQVGELIVTSLSNLTQPLIRYRTGDRGATIKVNCGCGKRDALALVALEGRQHSDAHLGDRTIRIDSISRLMKRVQVRRFQVAVQSDSEVVLRYDAPTDLPPDVRDAISRVVDGDGPQIIRYERHDDQRPWPHNFSSKHRDFIDLRGDKPD